MRKKQSGSPRSDKNQPVQSQKRARSLKFQKRDCTIRVAKTKALMSCAVSAVQLLPLFLLMHVI